MITVYENRYVSVKNIYGTQNENNVTELEIQVPEQYKNWNKRIVFVTDEGNKWDLINGNIYKLKNNITKYQEVYCYIWLTKNSEAEEESIDDFRSETFRLFFNKNEQADDTVPSEEQLDGFNTLINELNVALDKVNNISSDIEKLKEEVTQTIEDLNTKVENGEFDGATFTPSVDEEGNISWTNDKGLQNPATRNIKGEKGDKGEQGVQGIPGEKGEQGNPFQIKKTYPSKEAMDLDYPNMEYNDYVMIASNVEDEDNAKLYVKAEGETGWVFITDFSGAQGIQGQKGDKPVKGVDYFTEQDKQELVNEVTQDATSSFNQNVTAKTNEFNTNATTKTNEFNSNVNTKINDFNQNSTTKTEEFNTNAQNKIDEFNQNTEVFENRLTSLETNDTKQDELIAKLRNNQFNLVAEGTSINVQDSSDLPAVLEVSGGERQATREGYNLLKGISTVSNATIDDSNLITTNEMTATYANIVGTLEEVLNISNTEQFYLSADIRLKSGTTNNPVLVFNNGTVDKEQVERPNISTSFQRYCYKITATSDFELNQVLIQFPSANSLIAEIKNIMISKEDRPYEQYGASPSPDYRSEVETVEGNLEINKVNKNWLKILDINETNKNGITYSAKNGILKLKGTSSSAVKIDLAYNVLLPANKYIHSTNIIQKGLYLSLDNLEETMISQSVGIKKNFQISSQTNYNIYFLWIDAGTTVDLELKPQLELGEVATEYTPHESEVYNLPIQQPMLKTNNYKDSFILKDDGNWYERHVIKKYIIDGKNNVLTNMNIKEAFTTFDFVVKTNIFTPQEYWTICNNALSNMFKPATLGSLVAGTDDKHVNKFCTWGTYARFSFENNKFTSIDEANQYLSDLNANNQPLKLFVALKTPVDLPCTPEQVEVLEQLNNMPTYRPVTNVFTQENLANLKLNYVADSKIYVDNKFNAMQANLDTINQLLSTTGTSSILLSNLQTDLESEVM